MLPYEIGQHWQRLTKNGLGTDWHKESSTFQFTQWLGVRNEMAFFKVGNEYGNKWKRRESGDKRLPGKTGVNRSKHDRKQFQVWKTKHEPFVRIYDRYLWIPLSNLWQKLVMTNRFKHIRLCFVFRTIANLSSAFFFYTWQFPRTHAQSNLHWVGLRKSELVFQIWHSKIHFSSLNRRDVEPWQVIMKIPSLETRKIHSP